MYSLKHEKDCHTWETKRPSKTPNMTEVILLKDERPVKSRKAKCMAGAADGPWPTCLTTLIFIVI